MKKHSFEWHGYRYYLLGANKDGRKYYLQSASFDCGWYWGIGYIRTFTNNKNPHLSKGILSHEHFETKLLEVKKSWLDAFKKAFPLDAFKEVFPDNPFSDNEIWKIYELMKSAYIAREYSNMLYRGGAWYISNPAKETIKNPEEYNRINKVVIPEIMKKLYAILEVE